MSCSRATKSCCSLAQGVLLLVFTTATNAFQLAPAAFTTRHDSHSYIPALYASNGNNNNEAAFAAFAESLEQDDTDLFPEVEKEDEAETTWQASLEMLLDPNISPAKRQILLSDLLGANAQIRESVLEALRERKVRAERKQTSKC